MIQFIKPYGLLVKGQMIDCPDNIAEQHILNKRAVIVKSRKKAKDKDDNRDS